MVARSVITVELTETTVQLAELLKTLEEKGSTVRLTRNGRAVAELIPMSDESQWPFPIYPELAVTFNGDPAAPLDEEDWPTEFR